MWNGSHETWVDSLKRHLKAWKLRGPAGDGSKGPWSDATICEFIVEAHNRIGGPEKTGIHFSPGSADEYNRKKANAARIMRTMTDDPQTDAEAVSLFLMLPSISAAMPTDLAISFWNEYLLPTRLAVRGVDDAAGDSITVNDLVAVMKEDAEAHQACAAVIEHPDMATLNAARTEIQQAIEQQTRLARVLDGMIRMKSTAGGAVKNFLRSGRTPH